MKKNLLALILPLLITGSLFAMQRDEEKGMREPVKLTNSSSHDDTIQKQFLYLTMACTVCCCCAGCAAVLLIVMNQYIKQPPKI